MKFWAAILLVIFSIAQAKSQKKPDSLLTVLKAEILKKNLYDAAKESRLKKLKQNLALTPKNNFSARYALYDQLYEAYQNYKFDSAHVYISRLVGVSNQLNDPVKLYESKIKLGSLQLSWGMYKETFDCIAQLNVNRLPDSTKLRYYGLKSRALNDLATYNTDEFYSPANHAESIKVLDSAMLLSPPGSYEKLKRTAQLLTIAGKKNQAIDILRQLFKDTSFNIHQLAMVANDMSHLVNEQEKEKLITTAAIYDIRSSTKQTLAIFTLGNILFKKGDLDNAALLLKEAAAQAHFFGSLLREREALTVLTRVEAQRLLDLENKKNNALTLLIFTVSAALIGIAIVSFVVYKRLKEVRVRERRVKEKYEHLGTINKRLLEDAHIKEEYIGYFFNVISGYILRLEKIKRNTEHKLKIKNYEDLLRLAKEIDIKHERENLFYTFDNIFLKLFPNFIVAFNALLKPEDQIWPKENELLNINLRIFALMRLGIKDGQTIANILESTLSTIYTYRNRIKTKALFHGDDFDNKIMAIKFVDVKAD